MNAVGVRPAGRLPGYQGIWVFVLIDLSLFGFLFLAYCLARFEHPQAFAESQQTLDIVLGLVNLSLLLTSSWWVALAVDAARHQRQQAATRLLVLGWLCGLGFVVIKLIEYRAKFKAGISMLSNDFFMFYFITTFFHFLHVLGGMVILAVISSKARKGAYAHGNTAGIESGAIYWHMVDLLWVMLFPLLYLAR